MRGTTAHAQTDSKVSVAANDEKPCIADFAKQLASTKNRSTNGGTSRAALHGATAPSLPSGSSEASVANDCTAIGRHLAELEADATHGPQHRPDEATCEKCAGHYTTMCETQSWSAERRACSLAAGDLLNAHLCAGAQNPSSTPATTFAPELQCAALGAHIATTVHAGGLYSEVTDMPQQVDSACQLGGWSLELRQCFAAAGSIATLQACVDPATAP